MVEVEVEVGVGVGVEVVVGVVVEVGVEVVATPRRGSCYLSLQMMSRKRSLAADPEREKSARESEASERPTVFKPGNASGAGGKQPVHTAEQTRQHMQTISKALEDGWGIERVMRAAPQIGISRGRAKALVMRIWEENRIADAQERQHARALSIKRNFRHLALALVPDAKTGRINHQAVARYETILANLQGTFEPIQISVVDRVAQSLVPTISSLSGTQVDAYIARAQERKALAAIAVKMLEEQKDAKAIVVKGEAAE